MEYLVFLRIYILTISTYVALNRMMGLEEILKEERNDSRDPESQMNGPGYERENQQKLINIDD